VSDTHNQTPSLPKGDVLIHAGDLTNQGSMSELKKMVTWLEKADFEAKIVIAGKTTSISSSRCKANS
jgi:3',5'-cyclic AMP phosphodiesterase CpdA